MVERTGAASAADSAEFLRGLSESSERRRRSSSRQGVIHLKTQFECLGIVIGGGDYSGCWIHVQPEAAAKLCCSHKG